MRVLALGLLTGLLVAGAWSTDDEPAIADPTSEDLSAWFAEKSVTPGHKGKPVEPVPVAAPKPPSGPMDPSPVPVISDPVLAKSGIPTETLQAIADGNAEALHRVRQAAADLVVSKTLREDVGKAIFEAAGRLAEEGRQARQSGRLLPGESAALKQLVRAAGLSKTGAATVGNFDMARAIESDAFEGNSRLRNPLTRTDRGTNFFGGRAAPPPAVAAPEPRRPGKSVPQSMDDTSYRQRIAHKLNHLEVPPLDPAAEKKELSFLAKGVKIRIDDSVIDGAIDRRGASTLLAEAGELESRLLRSKSGLDTLRELESYSARLSRDLLKTTRTLIPAPDLQLISLRGLSKELAVYATRWGDRPERLQHLGVRRLHGFHRDATGDLILVGRVGTIGEFIRVDDLLVALAAVYRDNRTPQVSLDPEPALPGGPQWCRVLGIPGDSSFARILLEADYEMKRILAGAPEGRVNIPGLVTRESLFLDHPERIESGSFDRFWLFPIQPGPQEILIGPGGSSAVFDLNVQVLTEALSSEGSGTGRSSSDCVQAARSFTEHYDEISAQRPIFSTLRGLFDLVLLSRLLRRLAPMDDQLGSLLELPWSKVGVAEYYPGLTVVHTRADCVLTLRGGCDLDVRFGDQAFLQVGDPMYWKEGIPAARRPGSGSAGDERGETAYSLLDRGRFAEAWTEFNETVGRNPQDAHAYGGRALASALLGQLGRALGDGAWALRLDPDNASLQAIQAFVLLEAGKHDVLKVLGASARQELIGLLVRRSLSESELGHDAVALTLADRAVELGPVGAEAHAQRARLKLLAEKWDDVEKDAGEALRRHPDHGPALLARAKARLFQNRLALAEADATRAISHQEVADLVALRALIRLRGGNATGAAEDARRAIVLGGASPCVASVANAVRLHHSWGAQKAWALLEPSFRLPPKVQEILLPALKDAPGADLRLRISALQKALKALDSYEQNRGSGRSGAVREYLEIKLAATLAERKDPEAFTFLDQVQQRRPDWLSPALIRTSLLFQTGDRDGARRSFKAWEGRKPEGDLLLAQVLGTMPVPEQGIELLRFLLMLEIGDRDQAAILSCLDRVERLFEDSTARKAIRGLRQVIEASGAPQSGKDVPAQMAARLRGPWMEIRGELKEEKDAARGLLLSVFVVMSGSCDAMAGDIAATEEKLLALSKLSLDKLPNPMLDRMLPILRANFLEHAVACFARDWARDPRMVGIVMGTREFSAGLVADLSALEEAWVGRARKTGDPVFVYLLREELRRLRVRALAESAPRALAQIEKLLEVVLDPKKIKDLEARRDEIKKASGQGGEGPAVRSLVEESAKEMKKTLDLECLRTSLDKLSKRWPELAAAYASPSDLEARITESYLNGTP